MDRLSTKNATGVAPDGRWYPGDWNALQDAVAALQDFLQTIDVAGLRIGDSSIQLVKYGTAEARVSASLRTDGILRALGGLYAGAYTTTQRNAIAAGSRPTGLLIFNTTTSQIEINQGSDATPNWKPVGFDPAGSLVFNAQTASNFTISLSRVGDANPRFRLREDGKMQWGDGTATPDTSITRTAAGQLAITGAGSPDPIVTQSVAAASAFPPGVFFPFAGDAAHCPAGFFICDGSAISRTTYAALFAAIGTAWGIGDGSTTFNIPNMAGKAPYGKAASGTLGTLGASGGTVDHVHTGPNHNHGGSVTINNFTGNTGGNSSSTVVGNGGAQGTVAADGHTHGMTHGHTGSITVNNGGTGNTGTANPPYVVTSYIIKY